MPPRYGAGPITTALNLGALALLPGTWRGTGFSVMWRPDNPASQPPGPGGDPTLAPAGATKRFLQLNLTSETLGFHVIPGQVPNRGLGPQTDIELYGLHYLQQVSDNDPSPFENAGEALHIEPGLFMAVPASDASPSATIVRMGSIRHGVTVLMQGDAPGPTPTPGAPHIPPIYPIASLPTFTPADPPGATTTLGLGIQPANIPPPPAGQTNEHLVPEVVIANDNNPAVTEQSNSPVTPNVPGGPGFPPEFQDYINDPNQVLRDAIAEQEILGTTTINLSTDAVEQGVSQIPFLGVPSQAAVELSDPTAPLNPIPNAFVQSAAATFWIEWVRIPGHHHHRHHFDLPLDPGAHEAARRIEPFLDEPAYLQLQYSQTVILVFNKVLWPHVTVATLRLSAG